VNGTVSHFAQSEKKQWQPWTRCLDVVCPPNYILSKGSNVLLSFDYYKFVTIMAQE
jgi:hypothetical protein